MIAFLLLAVVYGVLAYKFYKMEHSAYKFLLAVLGLCVGVFVALLYYEIAGGKP